MDIGLSESERAKIVDALQVVLANQHVLYQKLRNYHWNVKGKHFMALHELFEQHYDELSKDIDEIAERIRSLGHYTNGTIAEYIKTATLKEGAAGITDETVMVKDLLKDYEHMISHMRGVSDVCAGNNDKGSEDIMVGLLQKLEKQSWMLRSMLNE